ncbi:MAG: hypothetical protein RJA83_86 [Pseudomonadota bacterium]|jgi:UDP-glucose 4-epimerase
MHVLVTGGCGFIGSNLVEFHLAKGDEVSVVDDLSTGSLDNIRPFQTNHKFHFEQADILHWENMQKAVAKADRIYHMSAVIGMYRVLAEPVKVLATNILGCEKLLHAIARSKSRPQVIIPSSSSVYGHSKSPVMNENLDLVIMSAAYPLKNYALSKIVTEALAGAYFHKYQIPVTIVRLFNTIGPRQSGQYGMVVPRFVKQACRGEPITVFGDGTQTRSFCDVRDAINAVNLLADRSENNGEIVNVGRDKEISINELAKLVCKLANSKSEIQYVPYIKAYGEELVDIKQRRPDLTKLYKLTGFKHQWTLEQTIENLICDYKPMNKT